MCLTCKAVSHFALTQCTITEGYVQLGFGIMHVDQRLACASIRDVCCQSKASKAGLHADSVVLDALSQVLHPEHGTVVMNVHGGGVPTASALAALFTAWLPFGSTEALSGYHQSTEKGQAVRQVTRTLR